MNKLGFSALSLEGMAVEVRRSGEGRWLDRYEGVEGREKLMVLGRKLFQDICQ